MELTLRWIVRHQRMVRIALGIGLGLFLGWLKIRWDVSYWVLAPLIVVGAVILVRLVAACGEILQKKALKIMNEQCDPYPFLEEMRTQLADPYAPQVEMILKINHAMALRNTGDYQRAWEILHGIHIDKYQTVTPMIKAVYYNNLTDILTILGNYDEAEVWYRKTVQIINDLPKKGLKVLENTRELAIAEHFYRIGDYPAALERYNAVKPATQFAEVEATMFRAKCAIAMDDPQMARENLDYVIQNGNKLHMVEVARQMLETL